jgi:hypothetical protein
MARPSFLVWRVFDSQKPNLLDGLLGVNIALAHASNTRTSPVAHTVPILHNGNAVRVPHRDSGMGFEVPDLKA